MNAGLVFQWLSRPLSHKAGAYEQTCPGVSVHVAVVPWEDAGKSHCPLPLLTLVHPLQEDPPSKHRESPVPFTLFPPMVIACKSTVQYPDQDITMDTIHPSYSYFPGFICACVCVCAHACTCVYLRVLSSFVLFFKWGIVIL